MTASARLSAKHSTSKTPPRLSANLSGSGFWKTSSPPVRPALEKVGVEFVSDVAPYELMKLRILNGGHAAIAYPGALLGHHFVHDAMADPLIRSLSDETGNRRDPADRT